jgi:uncharacterized membrane protein
VTAFQAHNKALYFGILGTAIFLMLTALGPGLYNSSALPITSWQFHVFNPLCHQETARSFSISGVQMAVCSRCLGIYGGFLLGCILMPLAAWIQPFAKISEKNWLIAAILLNLGDVIGNYFGVWTNTLNSRFLLGGFLGLSVAVILTNEFFIINKSE